MKKILLIFILCCSSAVHAQDIFAGYEKLFTPPLQYTAYKTRGQINIDGKLKEASWDSVAWSNSFTDIEGSLKPAPAFKTRFKMLWDSQYVYIAAELQELHIWATLKHHDDIIYHDNDFEIFIDPDGDTQNYFEVEVNAYNSIFDLLLNKPYRNGGLALLNWDVQNLRSAVSITGTLNNPKDIDKKWIVEMAIPFKSISLGDHLQVPNGQSIWRINFSRVEWDTNITSGIYSKKTDSTTHRLLPEHNWVWSPQGAVNMHMPERWGYLHFSNQAATLTNSNLPLPSSEELKKYLWLVFYKQQAYKHQHTKYADSLSQINIPLLIEAAGLNCNISLEATTSQFIATIQATTGTEKYQINQEGKITQL